MFHDDLFFLSPFPPSLFINTDESMAEAALASTEIKIGRSLQKDEIYFVRLQVTVFFHLQQKKRTEIMFISCWDFTELQIQFQVEKIRLRMIGRRERSNEDQVRMFSIQ